MDYKIDLKIDTKKLKKYQIIDKNIIEDTFYDLKMVIKFNNSFHNHYENIIFIKLKNNWFEINKFSNKIVKESVILNIFQPLILFYEKDIKINKNYETILKQRNKMDLDCFPLPYFYLYNLIYLENEKLNFINFYRNNKLIPNYKDVFNKNNNNKLNFKLEDINAKIPKKYKNKLIDKCGSYNTINKLVVNSFDLPLEICNHFLKKFCKDLNYKEFINLKTFEYNLNEHINLRKQFKRKVLEKRYLNNITKYYEKNTNSYYLIEIEFFKKWKDFLYNCNEKDSFIRKTFFTEFSIPININNKKLLTKDKNLKFNLENNKDFIIINEEKMKFLLNIYKIDYLIKYSINHDILIIKKFNFDLKLKENSEFIIDDKNSNLIEEINNYNKNNITDKEIKTLYEENKKLNKEVNLLYHDKNLEENFIKKKKNDLNKIKIYDLWKDKINEINNEKIKPKNKKSNKIYSMVINKVKKYNEYNYKRKSNETKKTNCKIKIKEFWNNKENLEHINKNFIKNSKENEKIKDSTKLIKNEKNKNIINKNHLKEKIIDKKIKNKIIKNFQKK